MVLCCGRRLGYRDSAAAHDQVMICGWRGRGRDAGISSWLQQPLLVAGALWHRQLAGALDETWVNACERLEWG